MYDAVDIDLHLEWSLSATVCSKPGPGLKQRYEAESQS
jgi:hypothetical protein